MEHMKNANYNGNSNVDCVVTSQPTAALNVSQEAL